VIRGILFDLGNTLLDFPRLNSSEVFHQGAEEAYAWLRELDQPVPPFKRFLRRQLRMIRWRYLRSRLTRREFSSLKVLRQASRAMGQKLTDQQVEELAWRWYLPLTRCATVEPMMHDVLAGFVRRGLRLGIVSNTFVPGEVLDRHMQQEDLLRYFPVRLYSCDVRYRKPDRRIFEQALHEVGLGSRETMFVGDSLHADIVGARRCGMVSVFKDPTGKKEHWTIRPTHRIVSVAELPGIVDSYNGPAAE
jgi:putative hydrolase of the HAD superfamily